MVYNKNCEVCKIDFLTNTHNKKYCSKKCKNYVENIKKINKRKLNPEKFREQDKRTYRNKVKYEPNVESICKYCNKNYIKKKVTSKTCGNKICMLVHAKETNKLKKKENYKKDPEKYKKRRKDYYYKNTEKVKQIAKNYSINNKEKEQQSKRIYREKNKTKISKKHKKYYKENKENLINKAKENYLNNKEIILEKNKKYYKENKDKILERSKIYVKNNREKINKYHKNKTKEDINFRLAKILRGRLRDALKGRTKKSLSAINLLGCSITYFKKYIEKKFDDTMTWDNYGFYGWHIDHIMPCASFDLINIEEQKKCFHYTNLQPLWSTENLSKGKKVIV